MIIIVTTNSQLFSLNIVGLSYLVLGSDCFFNYYQRLISKRSCYQSDLRAFDKE